MSESVIKIENVSKLYRLGEIGTGTISHDLNRFIAKIRGKEDPFQMIGQVNDRASKAVKGDLVWALKDINLEVKQGEILGIIGKNGAGKSTLLKLLSRVTSPTTGNIKVKGRLASLLEVGTGFHPEMTGRENIYMNGTIMGMRKWEIDRKLDEIVDFAGVAKYLDTPTKRYSSGMTVRLGFAIAAFLEPEILVVDEVLAVGDAEFQKKAIGKMQEVSKGEGRTVLFVSHNMASIKSLCNKSIVLVNGGIAFEGDVIEGVNKYLKVAVNSEKFDIKKFNNENIELLKVDVNSNKGEEINLTSGINIAVEFYNKKVNINLDCTLELSNSNDEIMFHQGCRLSEEKNSKIGVYRVNAIIQPSILNAGIYKLKISFGENRKHLLLKCIDVSIFEVENNDDYRSFRTLPGVLWPDLKWSKEFTNA